MISGTDLKTGVSFVMDKSLFQVVDYKHQKLGRGGAKIKLTLRNLETGAVLEKTIGTGTKVEEVETAKRKMQYLFKDKLNVYFMNPTTFEQVEVPLSLFSERIEFLKEGESVDLLFWGERPLALEIPPKVELAVVETDPGVKGDSASNSFKPAKLENGMTVKVPLFVRVGEKIRIDTRTKEYVERVSGGKN